MKTLSTLLAGTALAAALAASGVAFAQDGRGGDREAGPRGSGPGGIEFAAIDTNGDGVLDRTELAARSTDRLSRADANADGVLTRAELMAAMPQRSALRDVFGADPAAERADRILAREGSTTEGQVEIAVLATSQVNRLLTRLDANRDDALTLDEAGRPHHGEGRAHRDGPRRG